MTEQKKPPGQNPAARAEMLGVRNNPVPHLPTMSETQLRLRCVELAVDTVKIAREFSNFQIVHIADLYFKYISNGTVPPPPTPQQPVADDASV